MTMTTHVMQLSLMIEPVEVDNLQITVSQGIKSPYLLMIETVEVLITCIYPSADGDYDNSCDVTFIGTISMKVA